MKFYFFFKLLSLRWVEFYPLGILKAKPDPKWRKKQETSPLFAKWKRRYISLSPWITSCDSYFFRNSNYHFRYFSYLDRGFSHFAIPRQSNYHNFNFIILKYPCMCKRSYNRSFCRSPLWGEGTALNSAQSMYL